MLPEKSNNDDSLYDEIVNPDRKEPARSTVVSDILIEYETGWECARNIFDRWAADCLSTETLFVS